MNKMGPLVIKDFCIRTYKFTIQVISCLRPFNSHCYRQSEQHGNKIIRSDRKISKNRGRKIQGSRKRLNVKHKISKNGVRRGNLAAKTISFKINGYNIFAIEDNTMLA